MVQEPKQLLIQQATACVSQEKRDAWWRRHIDMEFLFMNVDEKFCRLEQQCAVSESELNTAANGFGGNSAIFTLPD